MGRLVGSPARFSAYRVGNKKSEGETARLVSTVAGGNVRLAKLAKKRKTVVVDELFISPAGGSLGVALTRVSFTGDEGRKGSCLAG